MNRRGQRSEYDGLQVPILFLIALVLAILIEAGKI